MSTVKFDYGDVSSIHGEIKSLIGTIKGDLETMNSDYEKVVQVPGEAIYGALGEQLLLCWDNVSSSFPKFMDNFDNWAAYVASSYQNYNDVEEKIKGFRDANKYGYSQGLTQRRMQAAADAEALAAGTTAQTVTAEDALAEIAPKEDGSPSNTFVQGSPLDNSQVSGYDKENLPKYNSLEAATGAEESGNGSRSVVDSYTEEEDFVRTAANRSGEGSDEAINGGDAGETTTEAEAIEDTANPVEGDKEPTSGSNDGENPGAEEESSDSTVPADSGSGDGEEITWRNRPINPDTVDAHGEVTKEDMIEVADDHQIVERTYADGTVERIVYSEEYPNGMVQAGPEEGGKNPPPGGGSPDGAVR